MLSASDLRAGFGAVEAVRGVSLELRRGELVALLGANGAGKSTLLRVLAGAVRQRSGSVRLDGVPIDGLDPAERVRRGIALVPEGGGVLPRLTVDENLSLGGTVVADPGERRQEVLQRLPLLRSLRRRVAGTLSGGEQRQLAIGRALMARPRVLLVDELSLGLSPRATALLAAVLADTAAEGTAVLLVEQRAEQALRLAVRGLVLERGRIVLSGAAGALLADRVALQRAYLGGEDLPHERAAPAAAGVGTPRLAADAAGPADEREAERLLLPLGNRVRRRLQELADGAGESVGAYVARVLAAHVAVEAERREVGVP